MDLTLAGMSETMKEPRTVEKKGRKWEESWVVLRAGMLGKMLETRTAALMEVSWAGQTAYMMVELTAGSWEMTMVDGTASSLVGMWVEMTAGELVQTMVGMMAS